MLTDQTPGGYCDNMMLSYWNRNSHSKDKTITLLSYLMGKILHILWSNIAGYCTQHNNYKGKILPEFALVKDNSSLTLMGKLWGNFHEFFKAKNHDKILRVHRTWKDCFYGDGPLQLCELCNLIQKPSSWRLRQSLGVPSHVAWPGSSITQPEPSAAHSRGEDQHEGHRPATLHSAMDRAMGPVSK